MGNDRSQEVGTFSWRKAPKCAARHVCVSAAPLEEAAFRNGKRIFVMQRLYGVRINGDYRGGHFSYQLSVTLQ